jgi:hypothetical protein
MSKKTWADVKKGDVVKLGEREWLVAKIKPKGKKATVVVELKGRRAESTVKLAEKVTIVTKGDGTKRGPLHDANGTSQRWATRKEHDRELGNVTTTLPTGDSAVSKAPAKAGADVWDRPSDKIEKKIDELLGARLVGESTDESAGYYVPPVDVSTIASHLALFHGGIPDAAADDETRMLVAHDAQHAEALRGAPLAVNHWHTKTRPEAGR